LDADTSITADTDDQIDIKVAGADDFQITANTLTALSGSTIKADTIAETTSANGVAVDGLNIKDGKLNTNDSVVQANITADAINATKIADNAISEEHLDVTSITGHTAETSIADGDLILIHDASATALRKMTKANFVSGIGGTNTPTFSVYKNGDQGSISANTWTKVTTFTEIFDPQSTWDVSNNKFTPAVAGKYFIYLTMYVTLVDGSTSYLALRKNGTQIIEIAFPSGRTTAGPIQLSAIVESDDNDYFEFYVKLPASNSTVFSNGVQTKCGGFKIIE